MINNEVQRSKNMASRILSDRRFSLSHLPPVPPVKKNMLRSYYRNGQLYQETPLLNGVRHGLVRLWHRNGQLASRLPYQHGALHGLCREWNENGKLLGEYEMVHGTGLQRAWHENHRLSTEFFTLEGRFSGRCRIWLNDGTLISDRLCLNNADASPEEYRQAAALNKRLPKLQGRLTNVDADNPKLEKHKLDVLVTNLLKKSPMEARTWLGAADGRRRSLGGFRMARHALQSKAGKFVNALYQAGAERVLVPDIYFSKSGDHYADSVLVKLPKDKTKRAAVRKFCVQLQAREAGAFQPDTDLGEAYLYIMPG
jgi:hypothetical protein